MPPERHNPPQHEDDANENNRVERRETPEITACEQQSDEANDSRLKPWSPLPPREQPRTKNAKTKNAKTKNAKTKNAKTKKTETKNATVEEVEEASEQEVNAETMMEEHHKDDKMKLNDKSQAVWENPRKMPNDGMGDTYNQRKSSTGRANPGDPRDDEVSDSLLISEANNNVPDIVVDPADPPHKSPAETNPESRNVINSHTVPSDTRKRRNTDAPGARNNRKDGAVRKPITPNANGGGETNDTGDHTTARLDQPAPPNTTTGSSGAMKADTASVLRRTSVQPGVAGSGTRNSPFLLPSEDTEERQNEGPERNVPNVSEDDRENNGNESVDDIDALITDFATEDEMFDDDEAPLSRVNDIGQGKNAEHEKEARVMLEHIITMACDPRQWAQFIGRNDYKITRGYVMAKDDGLEDAASLLLYLFQKINDTPEKSYSQTGHTNHEEILVTLNAPGASKAIAAPAVFGAYGDLSRLLRDYSDMSFTDLAKEIRKLSKDIAINAKYLFLAREKARGFTREPELEWSFVFFFDFYPLIIIF